MRDAHLAATASAWRASPVTSHASMPMAVELADRGRGLGLDRVGDRDEPGDPAVDGDADQAVRCRRRGSDPARERRAPRPRRAPPARRGRPAPSARRGHDADPADASKSAAGEAELALARAGDDRRPERVLAAGLERGRRSSSSAGDAAAVTTSVTAGGRASACPSCRTRRCRRLWRPRGPRRRGSGCPLAPRPVPTMIAVGVARPIAHGQAMMTTPMNAVRARSAAAPGRTTSQTTNVAAATTRTIGTKTSADPVGQALDGRLGALGALDQVDDLGERVSRPDRVARITNVPVVLRVAPITSSPLGLRPGWARR